ncbi:hypothetical protein [Flagellimonas sp.]|uniref:hypothetical protein n=1 Tax=Flagellimonas sp. TaxID=2058762 RepID=UPI003B51915D
MKIEKGLYIKFGIYAIIVMGLFSCKDGKNTLEKDQLDSLQNSVENALGSNLQIPDSLKVYAPFLEYVSDSVKMSKSHCKIYTYVNASCPTCIEKIKMWDDFVDKAIQNNVPVFMIFHSDDNFELLKHLSESGLIEDFKFPFFLDTEGIYTKNNPFMKDNVHMETVLTDQSNKILLIGNPLYSSDIANSYYSEIQKRTKLLTVNAK